LIFFGFNEENLTRIQESFFYLIKWGFSYSDLKDIPVFEYNKYVSLLNNYYKEKKEAADKAKGY